MEVRLRSKMSHWPEHPYRFVWGRRGRIPQFSYFQVKIWSTFFKIIALFINNDEIKWPKIYLLSIFKFFKAETMCSNYVRPARPNSSRSWTWWAWPPSQCMSEDCKKLCRNGFRIQVSLSIFFFLHFSFLFTPAISLKITWIKSRCSHSKLFWHKNDGEN